MSTANIVSSAVVSTIGRVDVNRGAAVVSDILAAADYEPTGAPLPHKRSALHVELAPQLLDRA